MTSTGDHEDTPEAVLITGLFGVGKSTVLADMADLLDEAGVPCAALDLDWLTWTNVGGPTRRDEHRMMLVNLASVVANYRDRGATHFGLARTIRDRDELDSLCETMGMPVRVVELTVPYSQIEARLTTDPTLGRQRDLAQTNEWLSEPSSELAGVSFENVGPVRDVANAIVRWLGWPGAT